MNTEPASNMTKRELFASMFLQGILSGEASDCRYPFDTRVKQNCEEAISHADELMQQLTNQNHDN